MKILLDGYFDRNLGDDLMMKLCAEGLAGNEIYSKPRKTKADCYLKVIGSGFFLHNNLGMLYRMREMYREKRYAGMRAVLGCSLDKFRNGCAERLIRRQLAGYDFITVRDAFSYEYIKNNVPKVQCRLYPDMVFSLPDNMIPYAENEGALGISVHSSVSPVLLSDIADRYAEITGRKVILLCFDTGRENDGYTAQAVLSRMRNKDNAEIVQYTSVGDMLRNMKRCGVILGIRFHSIVLSARMGIPFVPAAYSDKTRRMLDGINYNGTVYGTDFNCDEVLQSVLSPEPYKLNGSIIKSARGHVEAFKEFMGGR